MRWRYAAEKEDDLSRWMKRVVGVRLRCQWISVALVLLSHSYSVDRVTFPYHITRRLVGYQLSHGEANSVPLIKMDLDEVH